ncbi:MAG: AbrB/MazE/SpoVT family DNA-binding domain-containing protein [Planctomycetes bacterium]|nr:AbrB/MazE/SpoVT family DNA-binding domain-containing protein [Planctomycetota bacterium]
MKKHLRVDRAGRVVLPKPVRRRFHLDCGALLDLEIEERAIILRPLAHEPTLVEDKGLLVHEGEPTGAVEDVVDIVRARRDVDAFGPVG